MGSPHIWEVRALDDETLTGSGGGVGGDGGAFRSELMRSTDSPRTATAILDRPILELMPDGLVPEVGRSTLQSMGVLELILYLLALFLLLSAIYFIVRYVHMICGQLGVYDRIPCCRRRNRARRRGGDVRFRRGGRRRRGVVKKTE